MTAALLGLTGAAGAGKDEVARILCRAGWLALAFADALRIEVAEAWATPIDLFTVRAGKDMPTRLLRIGWCNNAEFLRWATYVGLSLNDERSPRWTLQQWGSWRRSTDPAHWVQHAERWVHHHQLRGHSRLVLTDVRLPNEAAMLRQRGGYLVRVHRPGLPQLPPETASHESEQFATLRTDGEIHNDGDLQHLQAETCRVVLQLAKPAAGTTTATWSATP